MSKSSKAAEAQEVVRKRKVNPIYEQLDTQNWKAALKLCAKKDIADWDLVLALKAHALERLGATEEALETCRIVKQRNPSDSGVLSALSLTFKLMDLGDMATECYEAALTQQPANIEMTQEVFFSHCRNFSFSKQQQFAMKLYKQIPSPHFIMWSATSMLLHVRSPAGKGALSMLTISERMVKRVLDGRAEKGVRASAEEHRLLVRLLQEQGKHEKALAAVIAYGKDEAPLGSKKAAATAEAAKISDETSLQATGVPSEFLMMQPQERLQLEAELRVTARGDLAGAYACYSTLLENSPEQWSFHAASLDTLFAATGDGCGGSGGATSSSSPWIEAASILEKARASAWALQLEKPKSRAPFLLELELLKRQGSSGSPLPPSWVKEGREDPEEETTIVVCEYLDRFSSKPCCFLDLRPYLTLTKQQARDSLLACLAAKALESSQELERCGEVAQRIVFLRKHICCCQCLRFLSEGTKVAGDVKVEATRLFNLYLSTLDVNAGASGGQREVQHGDDLVLLAVHSVHDLCAMNEEDPHQEGTRYKLLLDAALMLEHALTCSPYNYNMKIELLSVYRALGAFERGVALFNDLKIRYIQVDSLSWLLVPGCRACALFTEARKQLREVLHIHRSARRDAGDYCVKALECGNYTKALEISEFQRQRMDTSLQLHAARVDVCGLELLLSKHGAEEALAYLDDVAAPDEQQVSKAAPEALRRNSKCKAVEEGFSVNLDFSVLVSYTEDAVSSPRGEVSNLESRVLVGTCVLRALRACLRVSYEPGQAPGSNNADLTAQVLTFRQVVENHGKPLFSSASTETASLAQVSKVASLFSARHSELGAVEDLGLQLQLQFFEGTLELTHSEKQLPSDTPMLGAVETLKKLRQVLITNAPETALSPTLPLWLESVSSFVDSTVSATCLILQAWVHKTSPKKGKGKKNKGAATNSSLSPLAEAVRLVRSTTVEFLDLLSSILEDRLADHCVPESALSESLPVIAAGVRMAGVGVGWSWSWLELELAGVGVGWSWHGWSWSCTGAPWLGVPGAGMAGVGVGMAGVGVAPARLG